MREIRLLSGLAQRHFHIKMPSLSRYKGSAVLSRHREYGVGESPPGFCFSINANRRSLGFARDDKVEERPRILGCVVGDGQNQHNSNDLVSFARVLNAFSKLRRPEVGSVISFP
jgi:hypothetical protein